MTNDQDTGGSVDYYKVRITNPTGDVEPYTAECNDLIEAFNMTYAEGNVLKALWRIVAARQGKMKASWPGARYDAEKILFFGERVKNRAVRMELNQKNPVDTTQQGSKKVGIMGVPLR